MSETLDQWFVHVSRAWPPIAEYMPALLVGAISACFALVMFGLFRKYAIRALRGGHKDTLNWRNVLANVIGRTSRWAIVILSLGIAAAVTGAWTGWVQSAVTIIALAQSGLWAATFIKGLLDIYASQQTHDHSAFRNALSIVRILADVAIWSIVIMAILSNLGINITAMIAGLGIGGVAIGLAAQGIFADLFGSLSIVFDRPFVRGDFITFDDFSGTIETVGMKSTRIRALSGEQIVLSNAKLIQSTIRNYQLLRERRVLFTLGLAYETSAERIERVPDIIRAIIESSEGTRFDRCHFKSFGDFALIFEIVYYVQDADYNRYMDAQHTINIAIMKRFAEENLSFAYPTQTLHLVPARTPDRIDASDASRLKESCVHR